MRKFIWENINLQKIDEINKRFKYGRVRLTPMARAVLFLLKIYVFIMGILLAIKFYLIFSGGGA